MEDAEYGANRRKRFLCVRLARVPVPIEPGAITCARTFCRIHLSLECIQDSLKIGHLRGVGGRTQGISKILICRPKGNIDSCIPGPGAIRLIEIPLQVGKVPSAQQSNVSSCKDIQLARLNEIEEMVWNDRSINRVFSLKVVVVYSQDAISRD